MCRSTELRATSEFNFTGVIGRRFRRAQSDVRSIVGRNLRVLRALNVLCSHVLHCDFNPLDPEGNYSATSNNTKLVHWPLMGGLLHLVQRGGAWEGCGPPSPLLAVPNVTAHPSTASVPITVLTVALRF